MRDEFDFVEKKGLWYCGKLIKWMPKDDEDEGQEGSSIVSQDLKDWEQDQKEHDKLASLETFGNDS